MKTLISALGLCLFLVSNTAFGQQSERFIAASSHYAAGEYEACLKVLNAAEGSQDGDCLFVEANCHQKLGDLEKALHCYDLAEQHKCSMNALFLNRGICRLNLGLKEAAESDFNHHLALTPEDSKTLYYLGQLEYMRFNTAGSLAYLSQATAIEPNYIDAIFLEGGNYADIDKWEFAEQSFRRVLAINEFHLEARKALAMVLIQQNRMQEAIDELDKIKEGEDAVMAEVYFYKAEAFYSLHQDEAACELWTLSDHLGDPDAAKNLLNICQKGKSKLRKKKASYAKF